MRVVGSAFGRGCMLMSMWVFWNDFFTSLQCLTFYSDQFAMLLFVLAFHFILCLYTPPPPQPSVLISISFHILFIYPHPPPSVLAFHFILCLFLPPLPTHPTPCCSHAQLSFCFAGKIFSFLPEKLLQSQKKNKYGYSRMGLLRIQTLRYREPGVSVFVAWQGIWSSF